MPVTQLKRTAARDPKVAPPVESPPPHSSPPSLDPESAALVSSDGDASRPPRLPLEPSHADVSARSRHFLELTAFPHWSSSRSQPFAFASPGPCAYSPPAKIVARPALPRHHGSLKRSAARFSRHSSQYLRPNARYIGEQQSGKARYQISVTFKTVDLPNLLVSGYLKIDGLTEHHPEITTFFNGQIINNPLLHKLRLDRTDLGQDGIQPRHSFLTDNKEWGSSLANDLDHWRKLTGSALMSDCNFKDHLGSIRDGEADTNYLYMRWKEEFLVPDSRIKQIHGASFEGFYYIVLCIGNSPEPETSTPCTVEVPTMEAGTISGLYYHQSLEKFQSLNLRYVPNHGRSEVFEFC